MKASNYFANRDTIRIYISASHEMAPAGLGSEFIYAYIYIILYIHTYVIFSM